MADGRKQYVIEINGIQQSIDAVKSLTTQLDSLEKRVDALAKKNISISASGGGNTKALDEEAKMLQQIDQLHQKVAASEKAEYQELLHAKEELKEYQQIAKSIAAQDNLKTGINDTSTMMGMKAQLHDIKAAMQTLDVESDKFKQLQQEANQLNNKLKEIEQGYGQFGRNVGNYAEGVAQGMQKIVIKVGETAREFDNAREASRTLNMELKSMALNGQQGTKEYNDLNNAVKQMNSTLKDVETSSVAMDNLLDTMQGIVAVASTAKGLSSIFGFDEGAIEETIKKLVALQNVLQGIEVIRKQMQTQEGIGLLLSKGNKAVDALVTSIFGLGTASKGATIAVKALSTALKGIGIGLVVAAVSTLITKISDWIAKQEEAKKKAEELRQEENKLNASLQVQRVQLQNTLSTLERFNGSKKDEERIVKDLNSKYGQALGTYKTIAQWKDALKQKTDAYIESLKLEAQMQSLLKQLEDAYIKQREAQNYDVGFWEGLFEGAGAVRTRVKAQADQTVKELENAVTDMAKKIEANNKKHQINLYSPQTTNETKKKIKNDSKKVEDAVREAQNNINDLRLKLMREGLRKELAQLDENNRKEIEKIRKNGQKVEEQLLLQEKYYQEQRKKILQEYSKETIGIADENTARDIQTEIDKISNSLDELGRKMNVTFNEPKSTMDDFMKDLKEIKATIDEYDAVKEANVYRRESFNSEIANNPENDFKDSMNADERFAWFVSENKILREKISDYLKKERGLTDEEVEKVFVGSDIKTIKEAYDKTFRELSSLVEEYGDIDIISFAKDDENKPETYAKTLLSSMQQRMEITRGAYKKMLKQEQDFYREREKLQKKALDKEQKSLIDATEKEINQTQTMLMELKGNQSQKWSVLSSGELSDNPELGDLTSYFSKIRDENRDTYTDMEKEGISYVNRLDALYDQLVSISNQYAERRKKIETDTLKDIASSENKLFDQRFRDYEEYIQKMQKDMSNLPKTNKWGFTKGFKKSLKEISDATAAMRRQVQTDIDQVNDDFRNGIITEEDKNRLLANLRSLIREIEDINKESNNKEEDENERRRRIIREYVELVGQAVITVIQSIGEINQAAFEKELEDIDKQTEELEKQLDKQKELTKKYADDVDSIEDELSSARGDRRQHLIDQLNAQIAAQRESWAEEKRMEKEREKLEKKREELEYQNEVRKWKQSVLTAAINAALAISTAAINKYPIPAVPMIALATSISAAQMAAVLANKPRKFADGGLLEGRSHAQGGIKVLGGHAEVEGGEFITNRRTTAQNSDLLYYINSKKKKLDLSDMIEFYSDKPRKTIQAMKQRYDTGGVLPTELGNVNDRLIAAMEYYSERPTVVEVREIINKTDDVKRVRVLAGGE